MFDILQDSAYDITKGLLDEAWGGTFPDGGLDFPSACVLSQSSDVNSDLHIELGMVEATDTVSDVPWLADLTHGEVQGPRDSDSPFKFLNGEGDLPGMFGSALKAYGQVVAILSEYGVAYDNYDKWFRAQWGIDKETDLSSAIPTLRSHGNAMWGGLARKLSPATFCNLATSKQVRVKWHNRKRTDIGPDKLVDWPRLTAIAQTIGSYLLVEDRHAKKKRFDFKIVAREIPTAPNRPGDYLADFPHPEYWENRNVANSALQYLEGFRAASLHLARHALGATGTLTVHNDVDIPANAIAAFIKEHHIPPAPIDLGDYDDSGVFDFADKEPNKPVVQKTAPNVTIYTAFASVIRPYIDKNWKDMPTAFYLRGVVESLFAEDAKQKTAAEAEAISLIEKIVPEDFLLRFFRVVCLAKKSREDANEMVGSLLKALHAPRSVFRQHDFISVSLNVIRNKACWDWILTEISKQVTSHVMSKGIHFQMNSSLWRILSSNANGDIALAEIIRQRKTWWANEYMRRGKVVKDKRVMYQIKSRLFRATQINIDEDGGAWVNYEHAALVGALCQSARAFLRKKRAFKFNVESVVEPGNQRLEEYANTLDNTYQPAYKWKDGVLEYRRSVAYLLDDVREIMLFIASGMNDKFYAPKGDIDDKDKHMDDFSDEEDDAVSVVDVEEENLGEVGEDGSDAEEDMEDFFLDDDDIDSDDGEGGLVDLVGELQDNCSYIPLGDRMAMVAKYGRKVTVDEAKEIEVELHNLHMKNLANSVDTEEMYDGDIADQA